MFLSIIIPVYNEENTIIQILKKVNSQKEKNKLEIIISNDGSNDKTLELIKNNTHLYDKLVSNEKNMGKGHAIKKAINLIEGEVILIQDADLEYDPDDYNKLLKPIQNKTCNVVYGSRVLNKKRYSSGIFLSHFRTFGNHVLTIVSNILNYQKLTDAHTCYKIFQKDVFIKLNLKENDFAFCPEVTTKVSLLNEKIKEVPIFYRGRSVKDGKKIRFYDAIRALITILKYRYFIKFRK